MSEGINLFFGKSPVTKPKPVVKPVIVEPIVEKPVEKTSMSNNDLKKILTANIKKVSTMTVEEHTLYEKWVELNSANWAKNDVFKIQEIKEQLWIPKNPDDYLLLEPEVYLADSKENSQIWTILRRMTSTAKWSQSPGRFGKFLIRDKVTQMYLGVLSIGSDFIAIGGRDSYIGWNKKDKMDNGRLRHTCMASTIVPTQPLGYNYVGGKLASLMVISDVVENFWNDRYADKLAGVTTTSLYGAKGMSQYTGLKYWHECKFSEGKIPIEPSEEAYALIREWAKANHNEYYTDLMKPKGNGPASHTRPRLISFAFTKLGVKSVNNNFVRGVYFSDLYKNTREFLCSKDNELGEKKFDNSVKALSDMWKQKYARKRINRLVENNKVRNDILFYDDLIGNTFEYAKEKYLKEVGR